MSKENIVTAILMLVPAAICVDLVLSLYPSVSTSVGNGRWDAAILSIYAVFLCSYMFWIFSIEYWRYTRLHNLKSPVIDFLLVVMIFVSIREFGKRTGEVREAFAALACFLLALVVWEIVTILKGIRPYFNADKKSLKLKELLSLLLVVLGFDVSPNETTRWDEYRYWLISDSILLLLVVAGWLAFTLLRGIPDIVPRVCIFVVGFYIGILNTWRYRTAERHWRDALMSR